MKRLICAFILSTFAFHSPAIAEVDFVNIASLRSAAPERFQGDYITANKNTVSIDAPVIIPNVSAVPVVRVTWSKPVEIADVSLNVATNNANLLEVNHSFEADAQRLLTATFETVNQKLSHVDAEKVLLDRICNIVPALSAHDFECINRLSYRSAGEIDGFYMLFFARLYHGIPYLCNPPYAISLGNVEPPIPNEVTHGCIADEDHFTFSVSSPKELGIIADDIPLLPFSEIEKIITRRIEAGYIHSLDEIRLGYRIFIDPAYPGTEYILSPVWVFSGNMRASLNIPFVKNDVVFMPYKNMSSFAINAQTGEVYTFALEDAKDRKSAPHIITWQEAQQ